MMTADHNTADVPARAIHSPAQKTATARALREQTPSPSQDEWPVLEEEEVAATAAHKSEAESAADAQRIDLGADDSTSPGAPTPGLLAELVALRARLAEVEAEAAQARADAGKAHADARQIALYNRQLLDRLAALEETSATSPHSRGVHSRSRSWGGGDADTAPEEPSSRKQAASSLPPPAPRPASSANGGSEAGPPAPEDRIIYFHTPDGGKVPGLVQVTREGLLFGVMTATVRPSELIGMRTCTLEEGLDPTASVSSPPAAAGNADAKPVRKSFWRALLQRTVSATTAAAAAAAAAADSNVSSPSASPPAESPQTERTATAAAPGPATPISVVPPLLLRRSASFGSVYSSDEDDGTSVADSARADVDVVGAWEMVWKEGGGEGPLRRITFEGCVAGYTYIRDTLESWSAAATIPTGGAPDSKAGGVGCNVKAATAAAAAVSVSGLKDTGVPLDGRAPHLPPCRPHPSQLLQSEEVLRGLAAAMPQRYRHSHWTLLYSTWRDGISLATLLRKAELAKKDGSERLPCLLVVRDQSGHVFGGFTSEAWRVAPRYYGTGESFMFQAHPRQVMYRWSKANQYFQFASSDSLALGGGGHFALWLDSELAWGNSGRCDTFCSACLASSEEFRVRDVELWGIGL